MAREDKPLQLRPVDDEVVETTPVIRLDNPETERREKDLKPVRLGPLVVETEPSRRLDLPAKEEFELRTHQPGIEVLIDSEEVNPDALEENWGEQSSRRHPVPWGWFVLIGLVIIGAVVWSLTSVEESGVQANQHRIETQNVLVDDQKEELEATQLIERIESSLRAFFKAATVEELARLVRHPERVTPLMQAHYAENPVISGTLKTIKSLQPLTLDNRGNFWMASVALAEGTIKNLIVEILESGEPLIDWETLVCHQPMKWDDFATQRTADISMDFRVYVEPDNFYSHEFANADQWASFRLTALESEETLFGYVHAGSAEEQEILKLLNVNGGRKTTLILRLVVPEGLKSRRGVVIEKLVNSRWLYLDPPDTGS